MYTLRRAACWLLDWIGVNVDYLRRGKVRMMREVFSITTRYDALGMGLPDPATMCRGECEGTGWVPVKADDDDEQYRAAWTEAENVSPTDDGWHFVKCLDCGGTGHRKASKRV